MDWGMVGAVVGGITLIAGIAVPIDLHRRKERSELKLREQSKRDKERDDRQEPARAALVALGNIAVAAKSLEDGSITYDGLTELDLLDHAQSLRQHWHDPRLTGFFSSDEVKQVDRLLTLCIDRPPEFPSEEHVRAALATWDSRNDPFWMQIMLAKAVRAGVKQYYVAREMQEVAPHVAMALGRALHDKASTTTKVKLKKAVD